MPSFFLALLAAAAATLGGREAVRVVRLSAGLGQAHGLLVASWIACIMACVLAAWLGAGLAARLPPEAQAMLVAIVLLLAGLELLLLTPGQTPQEPTRSFGAILLVLCVAQMTGAAGFLVFALAAATGAPALAAAGGAIGSAAVLTAAWSIGPAWERRLPLRPLRFLIAGLLIAAALVTALNARGIWGA